MREQVLRQLEQVQAQELLPLPLVQELVPELVLLLLVQVQAQA